ncbi:PLDc N-terminal domain-containing protein [Streptomyces filamentosus]
MDDYPLLDVFWSMFWFFLWIMWIFLLVKIVNDVFRDHGLSGWGKAGWLLLCVLLPFVGVLVYVVARGPDMTRRDAERARASEAVFQDYVRRTTRTAPSGPAAPVRDRADELARLERLRDGGALTEAEFQRATAKLPA